MVPPSEQVELPRANGRVVDDVDGFPERTDIGQLSAD
jgi:hypothetical protein